MSDLFVLQEADKNDDPERREWTPIEDDTVLEANVTEIKQVTKPFKDDKTGEYVERVQFSFEVTEDGTFKGRRVKGETSTLFNDHPNCKMRNWVQEILASEIPPGFRFDPEAVKGSPVRIVIGKKVKPRSDGKGDWVENWVKDVWRQKSVAPPQSDSFAYQIKPEEVF